MTWQTLPTFSYGYPADPDDMNIISKNLLYLQERIHNTAIPTNEIQSHVYIADNSNYFMIEQMWIEHRSDNLYYRIEIRGESDNDDQDLYLRLRYFEDPYGASDYLDVTGHEEHINTVGKAWTMFSNSDQAADISGWGATPGEWYRIDIEVRSANKDNSDLWALVSFVYEQP